MKLVPRTRLTIPVLIVLLAAASVGLAILYPRAARPLVYPHQRPLVERATKAAAVTFGHSVEYQRRITFPVVMELTDRSCVDLRSTARDQGGNYVACYSRNGNVIEEVANTGF